MNLEFLRPCFDWKAFIKNSRKIITKTSVGFCRIIKTTYCGPITIYYIFFECFDVFFTFVSESVFGMVLTEIRILNKPD